MDSMLAEPKYGPQPMSMADIDLQSYVFWRTACMSRKGNTPVPKIKLHLREIGVRGLLQDLRFALRQLRKNPAYTVAATVMLAVAICANSTVFSWIDGTMLHPIP